MGSIYDFRDIEAILIKFPELKNGCLVDTNILISTSLPIDPFNEGAEILIGKLSTLKVPLYVNMNIRSEFLEIYRRILIPESLCDFLDDAEGLLNEHLLSKLRSVRTSYRKSLDAG